MRRQSLIPHDRTLYRQRHKIENMFGRIKDWRRIHTRYDRCAHTFMSAICIAATVIFWIGQRALSVDLFRFHGSITVNLFDRERFGGIVRGLRLWGPGKHGDRSDSDGHPD